MLLDANDPNFDSIRYELHDAVGKSIDNAVCFNSDTCELTVYLNACTADGTHGIAITDIVYESNKHLTAMCITGIVPGIRIYDTRNKEYVK